MKYEKRHHAYSATLGGVSVPADRLINDLDTEDQKMAIHYVGTYSEYNPISIKRHSAIGSICIAVHKDSNGSFQKEFKLEGFNSELRKGVPFEREPGISNLGISLSKQDLLRIAHAMDDSDYFGIRFYND